MAPQHAKWTPDVDEAPTTHPKTREQLVQENRARRRDEPAAAPQETDSESGTPATEPPVARAQPARSHAAKDAETAEHDVRIGPGDAGAQDAPTHAPEPVPDRKDSWRRALGILGAALVIGTVIALLL
jgi:hypothetical protein